MRIPLLKSLENWLRKKVKTLSRHSERVKQDREVFVVIYLDNQHRLLEHETRFLGTINYTEMHPREIVKSALRHNAAAVIVYHNHPSDITDASKADRAITSRIIEAVGLVDVRLSWYH